MNALELHPVDTLFFRDARPMEAGAGSGGHGANWPLPPVAHSALRLALLAKAGQVKDKREDKGHHRYDRTTKKQINNSMIFTEAFRSLRTIGPFPARAGKVYLPRPMDLVPAGDRDCALLQPVAGRYGESNLPVTWLHPVMAPGRAGKRQLPEWISVENYCRTLEGHAPDQLEAVRVAESEHRVGIEIDDDTNTTVEGRLYTAEHLRLAEGCSLWLQASLSERAASENHGLGIHDLRGSLLPLGGEGRMVRCEESAAGLNVPRPAGGPMVKWVLVSHAVFMGGWRPSWVDEQTGRVLLKAGDTQRQGEDRRAWQERVGPCRVSVPGWWPLVSPSRSISRDGTRASRGPSPPWLPCPRVPSTISMPKVRKKDACSSRRCTAVPARTSSARKEWDWDTADPGPPWTSPDVLRLESR